MHDFGAWAEKVGLSLEYRLLPSTHLGVTWGLSFLGWSAKSFSLVRRQVPPLRPPANLQEAFLWHSVYFCNEHGHGYYCTAFIREGIFTYGQLMNHDHCKRVRAILLTWRPVSPTGERHMHSIKPLAFHQPSQRGMLWGKGVFISFVAEDRSYPTKHNVVCASELNFGRGNYVAMDC